MSLFNIDRALPLDGPPTFSDGRVAALDGKKSFLITSPNANFVPEIVQGIVDVILCSDGKYGPMDPLQWPQIFTPRYRYLSAIPKRVPDSHSWSPMFRAPTQQDFVVITGTPVAGFGLLRSQFVAPLRELASTMSQHVAEHLLDRDIQQSQELRWHEVAMRHAVSRLALMSSTYLDQVLQVAELQRHWLMAAGYLEYERRVKGLSTIGRGFSCADHAMIGAWTSDPQVVQSLLAVNIPVWFVRHIHLLHDDIRIDHVSPLLQPTALCFDHFPGVDNVLFHGLVGESHLGSMMQGGHGYLDISRVPSAAVYALSDFAGVVSNREAKTLSRPNAQSASTSQAPPRVVGSQGGRALAPTRIRPKPYDAAPNRTVHPSQMRGRDKFLEFPHKWMPPPIPSWSRAMSDTDRSMPARPADEIWGYWIPDPGLLLGPKDESRQRLYISNWVRARPIWLYLLHVPNSRACKVAPQFWRSFLNGMPDDPVSTTRTGKRVMEIRNIFAEVFREEDFDVEAKGPVTWHGRTFQLVPDDLAPGVVWEVFDLGFRYEFLALDRYLRSGSRSRHDETQREELLGSVFPGGWLRSVDSLPSSDTHGLFASVPHRRVSALNAFREVLVRWPACPDRIVSASPLQLGDSVQQIDGFEYDLARFYVDTFFFCSGRAPLVPHIYPA